MAILRSYMIPWWLHGVWWTWGDVRVDGWMNSPIYMKKLPVKFLKSLLSLLSKNNFNILLKNLTSKIMGKLSDWICKTGFWTLCVFMTINNLLAILLWIVLSSLYAQHTLRTLLDVLSTGINQVPITTGWRRKMSRPMNTGGINPATLQPLCESVPGPP